MKGMKGVKGKVCCSYLQILHAFHTLHGKNLQRLGIHNLQAKIGAMLNSY
ncbi:hypothetical protein BMETH_1382_1 [methanotrophic bacterial endosymbiont of Bathymodiolus sp.]|nr:hypothetical protein BMETH_1382_1 [methanotrophic bacterial endosymbiont of Bathymodiolus sp.]